MPSVMASQLSLLIDGCTKQHRRSVPFSSPETPTHIFFLCVPQCGVLPYYFCCCRPSGNSVSGVAWCNEPPNAEPSASVSVAHVILSLPMCCWVLDVSSVFYLVGQPKLSVST